MKSRNTYMHKNCVQAVDKPCRNWVSTVRLSIDGSVYPHPSRARLSTKIGFPRFAPLLVPRSFSHALTEAKTRFSTLSTPPITTTIMYINNYLLIIGA
jgi:hypothetical protein